jgi:hypothetical protein
MEDPPILRDEPLSELARGILRRLIASPVSEEALKSEFGEAYEDGLWLLRRFAFGRWPVVERQPAFYRVGSFALIPESHRRRLRAIKPFAAEYWGGTMAIVALEGTVSNGWIIEAGEAPLYGAARAGQLEVWVWNRYGSDALWMSVGKDVEIVPWETPLTLADNLSWNTRAGRCWGSGRDRHLLHLKVHVRIPALKNGAQLPVQRSYSRLQ